MLLTWSGVQRLHDPGQVLSEALFPQIPAVGAVGKELVVVFYILADQLGGKHVVCRMHWGFLNTLDDLATISVSVATITPRAPQSFYFADKPISFLRHRREDVEQTSASTAEK